MKLALITDTHYGLRGDSIAFENYIYKFYDNVFFPYLEKHDIKTVIHLGDVVDRRKYINYRTLNQFRTKVINRLWDMKIDTHILVGNHDLYHKSDTSINSIQELFSTYDGKIEPWIYNTATEVEFDGLKILFVPWITEGNEKNSLDLIKNTKAQIVMGHLEIAGFQMHRGTPNAFGQDPTMYDTFDMVMTGHYHHKSDNGTIFYLGAPYEMTWSDYQDVRGFHIFDTDTKKLEHIRNPYRMYHKIFYNDKDKTFEEVVDRDYSIYENTCIKLVVQEKCEPYWFDIVMDKIYKHNPFNLTVVEDYNNELLSVSPDMTVDQAKNTLEILSTYIDGTKTEFKTEIQELIQDLYKDALKVEND